MVFIEKLNMRGLKWGALAVACEVRMERKYLIQVVIQSMVQGMARYGGKHGLSMAL